MTPVKIMVNGLPGNMAATVVRHVLADERFELIDYSLTGPEIADAACQVEDRAVELIRPEAREDRVAVISASTGPFISVDYTHPSAINENAEFYCRSGLPFVMGTTGGDRARLVATVTASDTAAVIAPNMGKQIVAFQAMLEFAADHFPALFQGYALDVRESHQQGKADTSGTAKAVVASFNRLGIPFAEADIVKERNPEAQRGRWGIPEAYLGGHGWHTYTLTSGDGTVRFEFTHNVNGREIYARGTLDAVAFLAGKVAEGARGRVFSMIDVLRGS